MKIRESIIFVVVVVFVLGCASSRTRDGVDEGDSSLEQRDGENEISGESVSRNDGSSDSASDSHTDASLDIPDGSSDDTRSRSDRDTSPPTYDVSGSGGYSGSIGIYDSSTSQNTNDSSSGSGDSGNPDPKPDDSSIPGNPPQLTCFDEKCLESIDIGRACCTTGEEPYSWNADRCGVDLSGFSHLFAIDTTNCVQLNRPGQIDSFCPDQMPIATPAVMELEPGCCMESGFCGAWSLTLPLGCHADLLTGEQGQPCRLFSTPEECREVFDERDELTSLQECICDNCLDDLLVCRRNLGCTKIWNCMLESGCRKGSDCYLNPPSPCRDEFESNTAVSLSMALELSTCVQDDCE